MNTVTHAFIYVRLCVFGLAFSRRLKYPKNIYEQEKKKQFINRLIRLS